VCDRETDRQTQGNSIYCTSIALHVKDSLKFGHVVFEILKCTDRHKQAYRHVDCRAVAGKVMTLQEKA